MQNITDNMLENMSDEQAGQVMVYDEDLARKVLEMHLAHTTDGMEPVLEQDESPFCTNQVDLDILAQVVELQARMKRGMEMIQSVESKYVQPYLEAKKAFNKAKEVIFGQYNGDVPAKWWDRFRTLQAERNGRYSLMMENVAKRQRYWDHWKVLRDECMDLIQGDKAIWAVYFTIENGEEYQGKKYESLEKFYEEYLAKDFVECNNSEDIDTQKDLSLKGTDQMEEYLISHLKEQSELLSY